MQLPSRLPVPTIALACLLGWGLAGAGGAASPEEAAGDAPRLELSGWLHASYTASTARDSNAPLGLNDSANAPLLHQAFVRIARPAQEKADRTTLGFQIDLLYGSDYRYTRAFGLLPEPVATTGFDPALFYLELRSPEVGQGLLLHVGRFLSPYGLEVIDSPDEPFVSHAYAFVYNPATHMGGLATIELDDRHSVIGGVTLGSDMFFSPAARTTAVVGARFEPPDRSQSAQVTAILGPHSFDEEQGARRMNLVDATYTRKLGPRDTLGLEAHVGWQDGVPELGDCRWYGAFARLCRALDEKTTLALRLEQFRDEQGDATGTAGLYTAVTAGVSHKPSPRWVFRAEIRADRNHDAPAFESRSELRTFALDIVRIW